MNEFFDFLIEKQITVAVAESCTGGKIAARFVEYPGISEVFIAGLVTYADSAKRKLLGVKSSTLDLFGAVSAKCACEMALGACKAAQTCCAVSTTGIAGPGGGSKDKPVGLVYIGVCYDKKAFSRKFIFSGTREEIREQATNKALEELKRTVMKNGGV